MITVYDDHDDFDPCDEDEWDRSYEGWQLDTRCGREVAA